MGVRHAADRLRSSDGRMHIDRRFGIPGADRFAALADSFSPGVRPHGNGTSSLGHAHSPNGNAVALGDRPSC